MYCGETSVTEENLGPLLQAAKFFQVSDLSNLLSSPIGRAISYIFTVLLYQVKGLSSMTKEALGLPSSPAKPNTVNGLY